MFKNNKNNEALGKELFELVKKHNIDLSSAQFCKLYIQQDIPPFSFHTSNIYSLALNVLPCKVSTQ